jgi:hypothetical protein
MKGQAKTMPSLDPRPIPGPVGRAVAGWHARRIADPIERLRFLRHTVGDRRVWHPGTAAGKSFWRKHRTRAAFGLAVVVLLPAGRFVGAVRLWNRPAAVVYAGPAAQESVADVWMVEEKPEYEVYSNGLRVERKYETANRPRTYRAYPRGAELPDAGEERSWPAGIVFHTTESYLVAFEKDKTRELKKYGDWVARYVQREQAYHYLIDRFGRVWRIVRETDVANHAGYSVWADDKSTYLNLNHSFIGVSLEAQTRSEQGRPSMNPAQLHGLRVLTAMLRSRYRIEARNCVTHAQVSVSPASGQVSYHTDWALGFPYSEIGLPDNYNIPSPAIGQFGFTYDPALVNLSDTPFWKGLLLGEDQFRQGATAHGVPVDIFRDRQSKVYRDVLRSLKNASTEKSDETREKQG